MAPPLLELEGTWEELLARAHEFAGHRLRIIVLPDEAPTETPPRKLSIEEKLLARARAIPPEERAKLPPDLAEQHDHYIYGWPKK